MADPAYIKNLRAFTRGDLNVSHIEALEQELYGASDRATAVMFGAIVENGLQYLLETEIKPDLNSKDRSKIFSTFASKTALAYALKLIGPISRADLDLIQLLRNAFAHSRKPFGFDAPEVKAVCDELKIPDLPGAYIPDGFLERVPFEQLKAANDISNPRTRYISACHNLSYRLLNAGGGFRVGMAVGARPPDLP
jgi:hypothetical protein